MPKHFVRKTWDRWLCRNRRSFTHPPRITLSRKHYFELQFQGITREIRCLISKRGQVQLYVFYREEPWDSLVDFDLVETRNSSGQYYCGLCTEPEVFSSRQALWDRHSFDRLLEWTGRHFKESIWLCLSGKKDHYTAAHLKQEDEIERIRNEDEGFVDAFPVVRSGKGACLVPGGTT